MNGNVVTVYNQYINVDNVGCMFNQLCWLCKVTQPVLSTLSLSCQQCRNPVFTGTAQSVAIGSLHHA